MATCKAKTIEEIDNIMEMCQTMTALGISCEGLKTLDQMKAKVRETLNPSDDEPSWTAGQVRILQVEYNQNASKKTKTNKKTNKSDGNCVPH